MYLPLPSLKRAVWEGSIGNRETTRKGDILTHCFHSILKLHLHLSFLSVWNPERCSWSLSQVLSLTSMDSLYIHEASMLLLILLLSFNRRAATSRAFRASSVVLNSPPFPDWSQMHGGLTFGCRLWSNRDLQKPMQRTSYQRGTGHTFKF